MTSLVKDLSDGVRLIQLMVCLIFRADFSSFADNYAGDHGYISLCCCGLLSMFNHLSGDTSLGRYNKNPRMRVQKAENVNKALEFITSRGVKLTNIGPEGECIVSFTIYLLKLQH